MLKLRFYNLTPPASVESGGWQIAASCEWNASGRWSAGWARVSNRAGATGRTEGYS